MTTACAAEDAATTLPAADSPPALQRIIGNRPAPAEDVFQVFICDVPADSADPTFAGALRLPLTPHGVATIMQAHVRPYFERLSHGSYRPAFTVGQSIAMSASETGEQCVEQAVDASAPDAAAVMVVANAEHVATAPGGWGRQGTPCRFGFCAASSTRRAFSVGASDFHPDWGPVPLLDLIEHEIGHTLGLPHSVDGRSDDGRQGQDEHSSALDVMSNSAAPRDVQPGRLHGQDTLAINRLSLGWLGIDDVAIAAPGGGTYELAGSGERYGLRLLVLPVDDETFLTVEFIEAVGFDDFLPASGLAVHRVDQAPSACARTGPVRTEPCTGIDRAQTLLGSQPAHPQLLDTPASSLVADGWRITVVSITTSLRVDVRPADG